MSKIATGIATIPASTAFQGSTTPRMIPDSQIPDTKILEIFQNTTTIVKGPRRTDTILNIATTNDSPIAKGTS